MWGKLTSALMSFSGLINLFMPISMAIDANCDYFQNMVLGQQYYLHNPQYPSNYGTSASCRWVAQSPANTQIILTCEEISIPSTSGCSGDRLSISLSGNVDFTDAHNYCGAGTLSLASDANKLSVGLFSTWNSQGGRFLCSVTAVQGDGSTTPPPQGCDCGWRQSRRIVGGTETGINEYPAMAALIDLNLRNVYCGASIISTRYALSAAHCQRTVSTIALLVGDHDISTGTDTDSAALYAVSGFTSHPNWNSQTYANDIAVVQTRDIMLFSSNVGPICLPFRFSNANFDNTNVIALGWGLTEFSGPMSDKLQQVSLKVVNNTYCAQALPGDTIYANQLCSYGGVDKDPCQGDSGGPLYFYYSDTVRLYQVGIISYGQGCGTAKPGVNARVTSYLTWIVSVTSDATYCIK